MSDSELFNQMLEETLNLAPLSEEEDTGSTLELTQDPKKPVEVEGSSALELSQEHLQNTETTKQPKPAAPSRPSSDPVIYPQTAAVETSSEIETLPLEGPMSQMLHQVAVDFAEQLPALIQALNPPQALELQPSFASLMSFHQLQQQLESPEAHYSLLQMKPHRQQWILQLPNSFIEGLTYLQLDDFLSHCFQALLKSWHSIVELELSSFTHVSSLKDYPIAKADDLFVLQSFELRWGALQSTLHLAMPYVFSLNVSHYLFSENTTPSSTATPVKMIPFTAVVGTGQLSEDALNEVQEGQVILLDQGSADSVQIQVDQHTRFQGKLGISQGRYAIKVEKVIND